MGRHLHPHSIYYTQHGLFMDKQENIRSVEKQLLVCSLCVLFRIIGYGKEEEGRKNWNAAYFLGVNKLRSEEILRYYFFGSR